MYEFINTIACVAPYNCKTIVFPLQSYNILSIICKCAYTQFTLKKLIEKNNCIANI